MQIVKRARAIAEGLRVYYTGRPCKRGHLATRSTIHGACSACVREAQREARVALRARIREAEESRTSV